MSVTLRKKLHELAELSGVEEKTAEFVRNYLQELGPDQVVTGIGGHGVAAVFNGIEQGSGPRVLLRAELDALPIPEWAESSYASKTPGVSHKCGHDGHMAMVLAVAEMLAAGAVKKGSVVLLFQPAEEIGQGAGWVIQDEKFGALKPDWVFGLHNLPGFPLGQVILRRGVFASASVGLKVRFEGATSHAAEPHQGRSPAQAVAQAIQALSAVPQFQTALHEASKVTVIHARLGAPAFGTSPGEAEVMATLRAHRGDVLNRIKDKCMSMLQAIATAENLKMESSWVEEFPSTVNHDEAVDYVETAAEHLGMDIARQDVPFPWSEDFGNYTKNIRGAFWGLGSGLNHPALHHPNYDFPDDLIEKGASLFSEILRRTVGYTEVTAE